MVQQIKSQKMENKSIFRVNDEVFSHIRGWGVVEAVSETHVLGVKVRFETNRAYYTLDGKFRANDAHPELSFTEYELLYDGFSQERPLEAPPKDTIVWVKGGEGHEGHWVVRLSAGEFEDGVNLKCFINGHSSRSTNITGTWEMWTTDNPFI